MSDYKDEREVEDQLWFDRQIGRKLQQWDGAFEPPPLSLRETEQMVAIHKRQARKRLWRELALLWMVALVLLSGMQWVIARDWQWFAAFQAVTTAGAVLFLLRFRQKRETGLWKKP